MPCRLTRLKENDLVVTDTGLVFKKSRQRTRISFLRDAFELLFEDCKPLLDVFKVLGTRENDLS